jgi:hypothetical protein
MIENPFLVPPQVESPQSRSWGRGFAFGFQGPPASVAPGTDFDVEDLDAFNEGTLAGQNAAIQGLAFTDDPCVDLHREPPPDLPELAWSGLDAVAVLKEIPKFFEKVGGIVFGAVTTLIDLSIALQTHFDDPNEALQDYASRLQQLFGGMSETSNAAFFIGGAVDFEQPGCELKVTPIFRNSDDAMQAARALGRPGPKFVACWRSDQSGGATVVASED